MANLSLTTTPNAETFRYFLDQVFLPTKVPNKEDSDIHLKDAALVARAARAAVAFKSLLPQSPTATGGANGAWEIMTRMLKSMHKIHLDGALPKATIESELRTMHIGDVLPIYLSSQNAGIIFRKRSANELTFESFEVSLPNETITGTVGKVVVKYPANSRLVVEIKDELLSTLANTISFLGSQHIGDVFPVAVKAGVGHENVRDTASPRYITEFIAGFLRGVGPMSNSRMNDQGTIFIQKRIDDRVVADGSKGNPWRRSAMWLLVRVAMQTTLEELCVAGGEGYKAFQAFFMAHLLEQCISFNLDDVVPDDVIHWMNRKLARRLWKLKDHVNAVAFPTLIYAGDIVSKVTTVLNTRWAETRENCNKPIEWTPPTPEAIQKSLELSLQTNQQYLRAVVERTQQLAQTTSQYDDAATTRALISACSTRQDPRSSELPTSINATEPELGMMDFEAWVEQQLSNWSNSHRTSTSDCNSLSSIMEAYSQRGLSAYAKSPERMSIFWLTLAELWVSFDKIVVNWDPLMARFSPEIPDGFLDPLLLPSASHLMRLEAVQSYLRARHNTASSGSLFGNINSPYSFQNAYFAQSSMLQEEKRKIERWGREKRESVLQEMREKNATHASLMAEYNRRSCDWYTYTTRWGDQAQGHSPYSCQKCTKLTQAQNMETSRFEDPLPTDPYQANTIVFELNCPAVFGLWRETTYRLLNRAFAHVQTMNSKIYALGQYSPTNQFHHCQERQISIASSTVSIASSFFGNPRGLPATAETVCFPHSGQYHLCENGSWLQTRGGSVLRPLCTFQLDTPYNHLGSFIENTLHTPNYVIATQSKCPVSISLGEYLTFGHLRAGNEIQVRNVMRAISCDSLSFNEAGVHSLIMQAIWQAGANNRGAWYRNAHQDLSVPQFAKDMLVVLGRNLENVGDSGREILHLATLVALAARLLSLSREAETHASCLSFLTRTREKAMQWMTLAEAELAASTSDDSSRLQHKMALIAIVLRLSFDVDADVLRGLCNSPENLTILLFAQMTIAADSTQPASLTNGAQLLLRRNKTLAHRLESHIFSILGLNQEPLHDATGRVLDDYQRGSQWVPLQGNATRWWKCTTSRTQHFAPLTICVDVLTGDILVDGRTPDRLPSAYIGHNTYQRLFGKSISLRSRPSRMPGMQYEATYRGMQLHFAMISGHLIVRLSREGAIEEYIPQSQVAGDVSSFFLHEKQHWYIERGEHRTIEIRPRQSQWDSAPRRNWTLTLSLPSGPSLRGSLQLKSSLGMQTAMDPHSQVFRALHNVVKGMEPNHLSISVVATMDTLQRRFISVSLLNHNLDFVVNTANRFECRTFPGYVLDNKPDIGCLYGLVDRIVLCDSSPSQRVRKVLVPRGRITAIQSTWRHPTLRINAAEKAGFHAYDVDKLVGRLIGNGTMESDLFLIQLHAFTSSHCPDPLINRTGTEEALELLASSSMFSHHDTSSRWRIHLEQIAALSPRREYYPQRMKVMEYVRWNSHLPTASQHPDFEKLVSDILSYWSDLDLRNANVEFCKPLQVAFGMVELSSRAALRDFRTTQSYAALQKNDRYDHRYTSRDVMHCLESKERELSAYKVAFCARYSAAGLPVSANLEQESRGWGTVHPTQVWSWSDSSEWFLGSTSSLWATLYKLCCDASRSQPSSQFGLAMTLSLLAYKGSIPLAILGSLAAIARDPAFQLPEYQHHLTRSLNVTQGSEFKEYDLRILVEAQQVGFDSSPERDLANAPGANHGERLRLRTAVYNREVASEVAVVINDLKSWWNDTRNNRPAIPIRYTPRLRGIATLISDTIQPLMESWLRNRHFFSHLGNVNRRILQTPNVLVPFTHYQPQTARFTRSHGNIVDVTLDDIMNHRNAAHEDIGVPIAEIPTFAKKQPFAVHELRVTKLGSLVGSLNAILQGKFEERYMDDFKQSVEAFSQTPLLVEAQVPSERVLDSFLKTQEEYCSIMQTQITEALLPSSPAETLLGAADLWPRVTSFILLSKLSLLHRSFTSENWITLISLYANQIISVQRARRLSIYGARKMVPEYNREVLHGRQRQMLGDPDWLLVEIDSDICIRSDQMDIANAMIAPREDRNTVMQMNMGEGKSSVIVPIVAATLADKKQLVRVVVLKPQSKLQLNLLRRRLAKLANRRVICLPFSRDLAPSSATAMKIPRILEACRNNGGIWLCQPEHLLSFKLLGLDLAMRAPNSLSVGCELIKCQMWMQENTRDILDESDEILHSRHQLVYTVGDQGNFDAAPARWEIVQDVLLFMQLELAARPSPYFLVEHVQSPGQFPCVRLMAEEGEQFFHDLASKIVRKPSIPSVRMASLPPRLKDAAVLFLTQRNLPINDPEIEYLREYCNVNNEDLMWQSLLLIRGLIAFNILPLALRSKRWRVDYGHDLRRSQLAVPYRAKDSPSLRSDFAHPDVLVLLTCLSYYYNGLDDGMIVRAVKELLKIDNPELVYEQWISPHRATVPGSLHKLSGVNVDDDSMIVRSLSPYVRHNKRAIDFFLNRCVFPREAKEFPLKMSTSGWDLAMLKPNPTTGFSGTNDSRFLLPTSIVQANSLAQRHTNATVIAHILQDENNKVVPHDNNLTSKQILDIIFNLEPRPTVLLDVGAQILDCSNEELVKLWLLQYDENGPIKAAVYFDDDDNMCILERNGSTQLFADSPFNNRLEECLVYLDDSHTRGTDLKLPACKAAVTLGPRLCKDKLVQGCMRMRKLGSQQSLVFLAPEEVIKEIKKVVPNGGVNVESTHALQWTMKETCRQLQVNVANWAMQGYEFAARQPGWSQVASGPKSSQEMKKLFCQEEGRSLTQLYGFDSRQSVLERAGYTQPSVTQSPIVQAIERHCRLFETFSLDDARAQEEQEVELVHEQEVEREVERPPPAVPAQHSIHAHVRQLVNTGFTVASSPAFRSVRQSLEQTSLIFPAGGDSAFNDLIVTNDFYRTIETTSNSTIDDFLRPLEWVVTSLMPGGPALVGISPYEANELLQSFRTSSRVKLHLFAPRTSVSMRTLEDLQLFTLPANLPRTPLPVQLSQQLNLYSGTLYLRDFQRYQELCTALRLYFGEVSDEIANRSVINSNGFVRDQATRAEYGLVGRGFDQDPVQFLRKFFHLRRNGRSFLPSHMGQILFGVGLTETSFDVQANETAV